MGEGGSERGREGGREGVKVRVSHATVTTNDIVVIITVIVSRQVRQTKAHIRDWKEELRMCCDELVTTSRRVTSAYEFNKF